MPPSAILAFLSAAGAATLAVGAATRATTSVPRAAFVAGMTVLALESLCAGLGARSADFAAIATWRQWQELALSALPAPWLLFSFTYARPNARVRRGNVSTLLIAAALLPGLAFFARDGLFDGADVLRPLAEAPVFRLRLAGFILTGLFLLGAVGVVMNLERTFRAAVGIIRWRLKFMLLGVGVIFVTRIYTGSQALVFRALDSGLDRIDAGALLVAVPLIARSFFRAGHFDSDVYPSATVIRHSLTLLLAGVYFVLIGGLAKAVIYFGGDVAFGGKAFAVLVALVALALVLQSDRAQQRLAQFVSRHFQRPLYDYRAVWKKVADATASRVDPIALARAVATLTAELFQALSVNVWLAAEKKDALVLAASTSSRDAGAAARDNASLAAAEILAHFAPPSQPADFETDPAPWAAALRLLHPAQFPNGGHRYAVPLVGSGEVLGVITLGDRVGGVPFSLQDLDMLTCIAGHAAASLRNVQLSQRLLESKELEAFQAMAAFFVHDLKNAASTLNLLLQNLPAHFDNPAFRADALRGVGKGVAHINGLIGRLGQLRHETKINLAPGDLNAAVAQALAGFDQAAGPLWIKEIQPLPEIPLDREQFNKVVTNLLLNATEAVPREGRVRVATGRENGWAVLTVDDNGCGMSREFVAHSLFRPFQTTKTTGLGIGMFQSKLIVEAHGGRIAVASEPGKGTTFNVFLPCPPIAAAPMRPVAATRSS